MSRKQNPIAKSTSVRESGPRQDAAREIMRAVGRLRGPQGHQLARKLRATLPELLASGGRHD